MSSGGLCGAARQPRRAPHADTEHIIFSAREQGSLCEETVSFPLRRKGDPTDNEMREDDFRDTGEGR